jgi:hypothetical protein
MPKLRVLVATERGQGHRAGDFAYCIPGELVMPCDPCHLRGCGCRRAFIGLSSRCGTTTAEVARIPGFTLADLTMAIAASLEHSGMGELVHYTPEGMAADLAVVTAAFPVGTVLEIRKGRIKARKGELLYGE